MSDLVSIVTPMFNGSEYIALTIESVLSQTYENWEMLIVDDCSTDDSVRIVSEYANRDPRIKLILREQNGGIATARNDAIQSARGRYLAFLDSDDLWVSNKLERQIEFMQQHDAAFSFTACYVVDESGRDLNRIRSAPERVDYKYMLKGNVINCLTVMIDTNRISNVSMPNIRHEDYVCWLDIFNEGVIGYGLNEPLAKYRANTLSTSANKFVAAGWQWDIYRNYLKFGFFKSVYYFIFYAAKAVIKRM